MTTHGDRALRLVYELLNCPSQVAYLQCAANQLRRLFSAELCLWTSIELISMTTTVLVDGGQLQDGVEQALSTQASEHPAILSYLANPADLSLRRVSDVASDRSWFESLVYRDPFRQYGARRQLSLVVLLEPPGRGEGWVLTRHGQDFTDTDVELAQMVLPALTAMDRLFRRLPVPVGHATMPTRGSTPLTRRETEVLKLISDGLTISAVSRTLGISSRTVHKHLEHAYIKLGQHDQLHAVDAARSLGLIAVPTGRGTL